MIDVRLIPITGLQGKGREALERLRPTAEAMVLDGALMLESAVKNRLTGTRSGRVYFVPGSSTTTYQASAPGESPASPTGNLRNSIGHTAPTWDGMSVSSDVGPGLGVVPRDGTNVESYARRMEVGGAHTQKRTQAILGPRGWFTVRAGTIIRTLPRPYMAPAILEVEESIYSMWERRV